MSWLILLALLKKLDKKIDDLETVTFRKVDELPATGEVNVIYFVPKTDAEEGNYSDEYIWDSASGSYEQIGDSMVDPLPEVTAADNGKVLGVANGEWDKISFNKDIDIFQIEQYSGDTYNLKNGKTMQDLLNTYQSGKIGLLKYVFSGVTYYYISLSSMHYVSIDNLTVSGEYLNKAIQLDVFRKISWGGSENKLTRKQFNLPAQMTIADYQKEVFVSEGGIIGYHTPNIANLYNKNSTYELGDLCIYNGNLYECTTAIPTAEYWTAAHWTQVKVSDELDKKANLTDIPADANHNIASAYDSTATYAVGDLCIYNGNLYECSTAISTAEAWDSTHWTQKTVAEELANAGGLPEVTASDNGKALIVQNGSWGKGTPNVITRFRIDYDATNNRYTLANSVTFNTIKNLIINNNEVVLYSITGTPDKPSTGGNLYIEFKFVNSWSNSSSIFFFGVSNNGVGILLHLNQSWNYIGIPYWGMSMLPAVTSSDEGKALLVNSSGKWVASNLPTELPSVTSSDEGKVLTVNSNGQWVASALPDGTNQQY